ncbi:MAG: hypothetical protein V1691_04160 [Chloroflexota bacterium]
MARGKISIVIADDGHSRQCDAGCGPDWSSAGVLALAQKQLKSRFGAGARLQYVDLSRPEAEPSSEDLRRQGRGLGWPLLVINDKARVAGQFDNRTMLDAVEAALEIER